MKNGRSLALILFTYHREFSGGIAPFRLPMPRAA